MKSVWTKLRVLLPLWLCAWVFDKGVDCESRGAEHYWYNEDNENSACYYCKVVRPGQLWEKPAMFHKLPNGTWGLTPWYPNVVTIKKDKADKDAASGEKKTDAGDAKDFCPKSRNARCVNTGRSERRLRHAHQMEALSQEADNNTSLRRRDYYHRYTAVGA